MGNNWIIPLLIIGGLLVGGWLIFTNIVIPAIGNGVTTRLKDPTVKAKLDKLNNDINTGKVARGSESQQQFFNILTGRQ